MFNYLRHAEAEMRLPGENQRAHAIQSAREARNLYDRARERMLLGLLWDILRGHRRDLLPLSDLVAQRRGQHALGVQMIRIDQIIGTEGRSSDFDARFRPLQPHTRSRWLAVATAMIHGLAIPPIDVVQAGEHYYVRDGHHRVSVARALGQVDIEATVTVWELAGQPVAETAVCATEAAA